MLRSRVQVTVEAFQGCYTQGKTIPQVLERIKEAIEICIEADGKESIKPLKFIGLQKVEIAR